LTRCSPPRSRPSSPLTGSSAPAMAARRRRVCPAATMPASTAWATASQGGTIATQRAGTCAHRACFMTLHQERCSAPHTATRKAAHCQARPVGTRRASRSRQCPPARRPSIRAPCGCLALCTWPSPSQPPSCAAGSGSHRNCRRCSPTVPCRPTRRSTASTAASCASSPRCRCRSCAPLKERSPPPSSPNSPRPLARAAPAARARAALAVSPPTWAQHARAMASPRPSTSRPVRSPSRHDQRSTVATYRAALPRAAPSLSAPAKRSTRASACRRPSPPRVSMSRQRRPASATAIYRVRRALVPSQRAPPRHVGTATATSRVCYSRRQRCRTTRPTAHRSSLCAPRKKGACGSTRKRRPTSQRPTTPQIGPP
jgi:hypothetical protein